MRTKLTAIVRHTCFVLMLLVAGTAVAQTVTVTGAVTDPQQEPLMGVVVAEKGNRPMES